MTAHELDIARQLVALAPLLHGDRYHCHHVLRPALFEAAVGLADLLRPELGEGVHLPLFEGTDEEGRPYKASLCLDNEARYNRRHADCSHNNCCPSVDRGRNESMRRDAACEYLVEDGWGPGPWEGLHEFRALRLWYGLAKILLARPVRTAERDDGTRVPVVDSATLTRLRELTDRIPDMIVVEEVHAH